MICEQPLTYQIVNSQQWVVKDAAQGCVGWSTKLKLHFEDGIKSSLAMMMMMMIVKPLNWKRSSPFSPVFDVLYEGNEENCI